MTTLATLTGTLIFLRFVAPSHCTLHNLALACFWGFWHMLLCSLGLYVMSIAGYQANKLSGFFVELAFLLASRLRISPKWYQYLSQINIQRTCQYPGKHTNNIPANFVCHIADFHKNFEELESSCWDQSDDCTTIRHQCLRHQPCGALGVSPPG